MKLKTLWPEDCPRVREALGMTEDGVKKDVAALKDWLRKQPHLGPLIGGQLHSCYIIGFWLIHYYLWNYLCCKSFLLSSKQAMLNIYYVIKRCILNIKDWFGTTVLYRIQKQHRSTVTKTNVFHMIKCSICEGEMTSGCRTSIDIITTELTRYYRDETAGFYPTNSSV